ncbi:MAG: type II secretion system protein [Ethanoligenens sp.]
MLQVYLSSLRKRKENLQKNKKGFTLIELIVVIAILAILMAILIPSISGVIGNARHQSAVADARSIYIAAQSVAAQQLQQGTSLATSTTAANLMDTSSAVGTSFTSALGTTLSGKISTTAASSSNPIYFQSVTISATGDVTQVVISEYNVPGDNGSSGGSITYKQ